MILFIWKTVWQLLKNISIHLPHDLAIALLNIYPREMKTYVHVKACIQLFIALLFVISQNQKQLKCPTTDE